MSSPDPITTEVVRYALETIAEEMGTALRRTALSVVIKDLRDYSCALFDDKGRLIAAALDIPSLMASMAPAVQACIAKWGDDIHDGDVFITNHPYLGCAHTSDVNIFMPVFAEDGALVGYVGAVAHHADWGGRVPGTAAFDSGSVFQEGVMLPALKLEERGVLNRGVFDIITANVRHPKQNEGDLRAQLASARAGRKQLKALARRYGSQTLNAAIASLIAYTERRTRQELARLPDGVYSAEGCIDDNGVEPGKPVKFAVDVTVKGETIAFDFRRTDPQMPGGMNIPQSSVRSAVQYAFTCLLPNDIPINEGVMAPIAISAPQGSAVNPTFPAAVGDRHIACERLCDVLVQAMAKIAPDRASASWCVGFPVFICESKSPKTGDGAVLLAIIAGGAGGSAEWDGASGVDVHLSNCSIIPAEVIESNYQIRIERYELIEDSAGAGRQRGGLGIRADYRNLSGAPMPVQTEIEQSNAGYPPLGMDGGRPGTLCSAHLIANGGETPLPSKGFYTIPIDGVVSLRAGGGGGYGDPMERAVDDVLRDVAAGRVSPERALKDHGVDVRRGKRVGAAA